MNRSQIFFLVPLCTFYVAYLVKMLLLKRQGIQGNLLGKGTKPHNVRRIERLIQCITYAGVPIQYFSVLFPTVLRPNYHLRPLWALGFILAWAAVLLFLGAVASMKQSWRAGFTENQDTALVTSGVYRLSRNPAFAGFDLLYIGCVLAYPNPLTVLWSILAVVTFHLQIKSEETYLAQAFGMAYDRYQGMTRRYF